MEHNEMVQKLHEKANIPASVARDALERADWDMLEALKILEEDGVIAPLTSSMTTIENKSAYEEVTASASGGKKSGKNYKEQGSGFCAKVVELLRKSMTHSFIIERKGEQILSLPVLIMTVITIAMFQPVIIALIVGLFLDCKYSFEERNEDNDNDKNKNNDNDNN